MMNKPYCIYGASGHGKVIIEILEKSNCAVDYLYDDDPLKQRLLEYEVTNDRNRLKVPHILWIIAIGNNRIRKEVVESNKLVYGQAVAPSANISQRTTIGKGAVIMPGATVNSSTKIGDHSIINTSASVDHDCILKHYVHISPNATLCGAVTVGEGTHIGAGAIVIPGIKIGKWAKIGAGAVVLNDIADFSVAVGNPCRIIKTVREH